MDFKQKFVRCYSNVKTHEQSPSEEEDPSLKPLPSYQIPSPLLRPDSMDRMFGPPKSARSKAFPEYDEPPQKQILDPASKLFLQWNLVFLFSCLVSLFVDPMYFMLPKVGGLVGRSPCLETDLRLKTIVTCIRTITDMFYLLHIVIKFRTAYVAPSSLVFGKGELVMDPKKISSRYLRSDFFVDLVAMLPLPQIAIWFVIPAIRTSHEEQNNSDLALIVLIQYIARLYVIFPLSSEIVKTAGVVTKTAWAGAAYHLLLYLIASNLMGSLWYLLSIQRQTTCWEAYCTLETSFNNGTICSFDYFHCYSFNEEDRQVWANSTIVFASCDPNNSNSTYNYGIFANSMVQGILTGNFLEKYFYILWWGLQNLSSYDQPLIPSKFIGETTFAIVIIVGGLVLFALLIGNMETYLHSITMRIEAWRLKRRDTEEWMTHRQLPPHLRDRVKQFLHYKWIVTQGVDEEAILHSLPPVLRRDIQRHLCLDLVRRVPLFAQMDDQLLDAICERLVSSLSTEGTDVVREGDPVTDMLFIIRGRLESSTTNGGQPGFFNSITLQPGDFCGEELLAWALLQKSTHNLPCSTRTVRALVEVEAFALGAEDIKFVANQFRRLHSKKLQHTFRYYSHHWRTWAACFIQTAWRQHRRRKMAKDLTRQESFSSVTDENVGDEKVQKDGNSRNEASASSIPLQAQQNLGVSIVTSWFAAKRRAQKPSEPDFSAEPDDFYWKRG